MAVPYKRGTPVRFRAGPRSSSSLTEYSISGNSRSRTVSGGTAGVPGFGYGFGWEFPVSGTVSGGTAIFVVAVANNVLDLREFSVPLLLEGSGLRGKG